MKNISGIYKIQSKCKPNKCYVGSAINIQKRWWVHLCELRANKHKNNKLQNHFNKYGESDLQFSILLGCEKGNLLKTEQYFLDSYRPWFNICITAGSSFGLKASEETRRKLSESHKGLLTGENHPMFGKHHTEETRKKLRVSHLGQLVWNKGKHGIYSEERLNKMRENLTNRIPLHLGKHHSEETKKKISEGHTGRKCFEETKHKMSIAHKNMSDEAKNNINKAKKGRIMSNEFKQKIKDSWIIRKQKREGLKLKVA